MSDNSNPVNSKIEIHYNNGFVYIQDGDKIHHFSYNILKSCLRKAFPKQF
jgi:hypothetical protein